jgi:cytochrome P450
VPETTAASFAFPAARGRCPFAPPPAYEQVLRERPISQVSLSDGSRAWLVTRHEDVRAVLGNRRISADPANAGYPFISPGYRAMATQSKSFIRMDDPEHARLRRMITGDFAARRVEALRPQIQQVADDLLDQMTARPPPADLVREFALPLSTLVICLLLGIPYGDHAFFQQSTNTVLDARSSAEQARHAREGLTLYLERLAAEKEQDPDEGIIGRLAARGELTRPQVARMGVLLLMAGHETTANMTAMSALALRRHPGQAARLHAEPELIGGAVEELLRYLTVAQEGLTRVATQALEVGGQTIAAGEGVICMLSTANRDDAVFEAAGELDVARDASRHLAFGFGVHQCPGQTLARLELQIALDALLRRLPDLRLAVPLEDLRFKPDSVIYGVETLPVTW